MIRGGQGAGADVSFLAAGVPAAALVLVVKRPKIRVNLVASRGAPGSALKCDTPGHGGSTAAIIMPVRPPRAYTSGAVDPFDAALRPPPDETPEEREARLAREEEARRVSAEIDAEIKAERQAKKKKRIVRLLLLGQSESGE